MLVWKTLHIVEQKPEISPQSHFLPPTLLGMGSYPFQVINDYYVSYLESSCISLIAAQMWTFVTLLPLIIGDLIPEEDHHWECFLLLLQIVKQCTARIVSVATAEYIAVLIEQHQKSFKQCYPSVLLTPKMHYMIHFSRQLLE